MKNKLIHKHQNSSGPLTYNKPRLLKEEKESAQFLKNWFTNSNRLKIYNNNVREVIQDDIDRVKGWYDEIINDDYVPDADNLDDAMKKRINRFNMLINNTTNRLNKEHKRLHLASLDNTSSQLNKNINSAINVPRYVLGESNSPYQTEIDLQFSNPNIGAYYSPIHKYIAYRPDTIKKSAIHEMTHASHLNASETKIKKIIKDLHEIKPISSYYDDPSEIYARLMQLREHLNIDPNKKWTIEEIQDLQDKQHKTLLDFRLDKFSYPPEILLQFFNDVAHNNSSENTSELLYAKKGNKLIPKHQNSSGPLMHNPYSAGNLVNSIYKIAKKDSSLGTPWHKYDFTQSEEWAEKHGYYKDERGHRDDRVKKTTHPTHPSRGTWKGMNQFHLTDKGIKDVNHTLFGMVDGGQDPQAVLYYQNGIVLPEITVTPKGTYIHNTYDNRKIEFKKGGKLFQNLNI